EVKTEIEAPGFYLVQDKIVAVKYNVEEPDKDKLRQALELLNELAEVWFKHVQDKFSTVIKWGANAPFGYILKQRGRWIPWLYLYGDPATGKTTLGKLILRIWGLDARHEKTGASIDTVARLGYVLSTSTFPILVNEPGGALSKEEIVEMIKNAVENITARGKYTRGTYTEYPALAPLIFTSNKFLPKDGALLRRFKVITFSYGEKIPLDKQKEFKEKVEPRLSILSEIGKCVAKQVIEDPNILEKMDGGILIEKCYESAGLQTPAWLGLEYTEASEMHEEIVEEFSERLRKYINDLFARYVSRVLEYDVISGSMASLQPSSIELGKKVEVMVSKGLLPGARLVDGKIAVTSALLRELGLEGRVTLKSLAEMLGWDYRSVRVGDKVTMGAVTEVAKIVDLLTPQQSQQAVQQQDQQGQQADAGEGAEEPS
ncbi:MAG: hypothetical protein QXQ90_07695, partial [Desulfurococcaceae archaeon]